MEQAISAIILAAGESKRMMHPKAFLKCRSGEYFIEKIISVYKAAGCIEIVCVINTMVYNQYRLLINKLAMNCRFVINDNPGYGRFYSILLALRNLKIKQYCFIHNIDNPEIDCTTLQKIIDNRHKAAVIIPSFEGKTGHPVLINEKVMKNIIDINSYNLRLDRFLEIYSTYHIKVTNVAILLNINTQDDYNIYLKGDF